MMVSRFSLALLAAVALAAAGCQLKSAPSAGSNYVTADPSTFVLHSVDRFEDPGGTETSSLIVVVRATYTNPEQNPEMITPSKFQLLDPNLMAVYYGLSGGNINVPSMPDTELAPGKSVDIAVAFRVPSSMTTARLTYRP